jgi:hypothetical protein
VRLELRILARIEDSATLHGARRLTYAHPQVRNLVLALLHLAVVPFVERLIGTMRREFLDHVLFWNARDLERKLAEFQTYYNEARSHASLAATRR